MKRGIRLGAGEFASPVRYPSGRFEKAAQVVVSIEGLVSLAYEEVVQIKIATAYPALLKVRLVSFEATEGL
ncbi:MAG: hypothetical protein KGL59_15370, partial [Acidobacteriota bacterium]|nr:hypothetical protein [Acidobacteriota bacterium]